MLTTYRHNATAVGMRRRGAPRLAAGSPSSLRRAGIMIADAVTGLLIISVLAASMTVALQRHERGSRRVADERAATWAAEAALARMQAGGAPAEAGDGPDEAAGTNDPPPPRVVVEPAEGGAAMVGHAWVRVRAEVNGRQSSLVGLVPADVAAAAMKATGAATSQPAAVPEVKP